MPIQRSPLKSKETMNEVTPAASVDPSTALNQATPALDQATPALNSWANIAKRKYPNLVLEFTPQVEDLGKKLNPKVSLDQVVGKFVFEDLQILRSELMEIRVFGSHTKTVRFRTKQDIVVADRWSHLPRDITKVHEGITWTCMVKGLKKKEAKLRIINVPEEASDQEIIQQISNFAPVSSVKDESVTKGQSQLFHGMSNGNKVVMIEDGDHVNPDTITLAGKDTKVVLVKPRCFNCNEIGHVAKSCTKEKTQPPKSTDQKLATYFNKILVPGTKNLNAQYKDQGQSRDQENDHEHQHTQDDPGRSFNDIPNPNDSSILYQELGNEETPTEDDATKNEEAEQTLDWFNAEELSTSGLDDPEETETEPAQVETRKAKGAALEKLKNIK